MITLHSPNVRIDLDLEGGAALVQLSPCQVAWTCRTSDLTQAAERIIRKQEDGDEFFVVGLPATTKYSSPDGADFLIEQVGPDQLLFMVDDGFQSHYAQALDASAFLDFCALIHWIVTPTSI